MSIPTPPPLEVPSDWIELRLPFNVGSGRTMYTGQEQSGRARFRFYRKVGDERIYGRAWFGPGTEGPPGYVHGGALAYALDEAMGSLSWANQYPAIASKLEFQYSRPTPMLVDLHIEACIQSATKNRLQIESFVRLPSGETLVTGIGTFAILSREQGLIFKNVDPEGVMQASHLKWSDG